LILKIELNVLNGKLYSKAMSLSNKMVIVGNLIWMQFGTILKEILQAL
jgi:hypothetical protein